MYKNLIKQYAGTHYGYALKIAEQFIYRCKIVEPGQPIPEHIFWDNFYKNEYALDEATLKGHAMEKGIPVSEAARIIKKDTFPEFVKSGIEERKTMKMDEKLDNPVDNAKLLDLIFVLRTQNNSMPILNKKVFGITIFAFLFILACIIALIIYIPWLGIPALLGFLILYGKLSRIFG